MIYRLILMGVTPSLNEWQRMHWHTKREVKRDWEMVCKVSQIKQLPNGIPNATSKCRIKLIRNGPRELDTDNLYGGVKPLLDAIKARGWIVDDAPKWMDLTVEQRKTTARDNPHMILEIEAME